jgi:hypothetical protein
MASAVLMFAGLALLVRGIVWGQLLSSRALVTALTWLFSLLLGVLGRGDEFVFGGWGAGIGVTIATFWQEYSEAQAQRPHPKPARHRAGQAQEEHGPAHDLHHWTTSGHQSGEHTGPRGGRRHAGSGQYPSPGSRPDGFHRGSQLGPALLELIGHTSTTRFRVGVDDAVGRCAHPMT